MKATLLVLFRLSLFGDFAGADVNVCHPVDLRSQLGEARDQGDSGWCFAHTTADLISQKLGLRVSAFDLATTFLLEDVRGLPRAVTPLAREYFRLNPDYVDRMRDARQDDEAYAREKIFTAKGLLNVGGVEEYAIVAANRKGLCLDERLPSESTPGQSYANNLRAIEAFHRGLSKAQRRSLRRNFSHLDHIADPVVRESAGAFQTWVDAQCGARVAAPELIPQQYYIADDADGIDILPPQVRRQRQRLLRQMIDHLLDQGRAVAIGYDANDVMVRDEDDPDKHADHSSIIAARRPGAAGCEVFVRNSFGRGCENFRPELRSVCETGGVWVTLDRLSSLFSAVWLDE